MAIFVSKLDNLVCCTILSIMRCPFRHFTAHNQQTTKNDIKEECNVWQCACRNTHFKQWFQCCVYMLVGHRITRTILRRVVSVFGRPIQINLETVLKHATTYLIMQNDLIKHYFSFYHKQREKILVVCYLDSRHRI